MTDFEAKILAAIDHVAKSLDLLNVNISRISTMGPSQQPPSSGPVPS
jgi:hypothetical protein